ncbi:MAG TPA: Smr/MutS family protein [Eoetvoesiella sp.]
MAASSAPTVDNKPATLASKWKRGKEAPSQASAPPSGAGTSVRQESAATLLDADDQTLFRRAVKTVQPIKNTRRAVLPPVPLASDAILRQRRDAAMGREAVKLSQVSDQYSPAKLKHDESSFLQAGCGPDLIKGLKRGKWPIGASLDLHGTTLDEARTRLDQFLQSCLAHQIKCVQVVHGKGYGSKDNTPVLKETVRRWLSQIASVIAYTECNEQNGGAGAVQVLLRVRDSTQR